MINVDTECQHIGKKNEYVYEVFLQINILLLIKNIFTIEMKCREEIYGGFCFIFVSWFLFFV